MRPDLVAVIFYVFILLMACVVVVLTVIYSANLGIFRSSRPRPKRTDLPMFTEETEEQPKPDIDRLEISMPQLPAIEPVMDHDFHQDQDLQVGISNGKEPEPDMKRSFFAKSPRLLGETQSQPMTASRNTDTKPEESSKQSEEAFLTDRDKQEAPMKESPAAEISLFEDNPGDGPRQGNIDKEAGQADESDALGLGPKPVPTDAADADSLKSASEKPEEQRPDDGDISDLFAKDMSEGTETNHLAEEMTDIDIGNLLQEGLGILSRIKK
jgi:hypothetical protein